MKACRFILILLLVPALVVAQSEPVITAPPVDSGNAVRPESIASPQDLGIAPDQQAIDKVLAEQEKRNIKNTPAAIPAVNTSAAAPQSSGGGGGQGMALGASLLAMCGALMGGPLGGKNAEMSEEMVEAMDRAKDEQGFQELPDFAASEELGTAINANYPAGCENNFIDKQGRLGPWGYTALEEIRRQPAAYVQNDPPDVLILCKNYQHFNVAKREQFWVWMFSSLAAPESSCNPNAANRNAPNGTAIGLFQLEAPFCNPVGVRGDLFNPHNNTRCAVRGLAVELNRRDNLMSPTSRSRDSRRTYWGPLRTDDHNKARGGDIRGAQKFRGLVGRFPGCGR